MKNGSSAGRRGKQLWENLEIIMALVVIVLCILSFFFYQKNRIIFALCFFAVALRFFFAGCEHMTPDRRHRRRVGQAVCWYLLALLFVVFGVIALLMTM